MVAILARACSSVTPGLSRPTPRNAALPRSVNAFCIAFGNRRSAMEAGIHRSGPKIEFTPMKCSGATPITVKVDAVHFQFPADDVLRAAEAFLPCRVVQNRNRVRAGNGVLLRREEASAGGSEAQRRKVIAGHQFAEEAFRRALLLQCDAARRSEARQRAEDPVARLVVFQLGVGDRKERRGFRSVLRVGRGHRRQFPEFRTGSGFRITVLISVKTVVFAPIPNASVSTTNNTKTGLFRMVRMA